MLSEIKAKYEFMNIKNVSREDILAVHRVPLQLMKIIPNNFGELEYINGASLFLNELVSILRRLKEFED